MCMCMVMYVCMCVCTCMCVCVCVCVFVCVHVCCVCVSLSLRVRARACEFKKKCGCVFVMARTLYRRRNTACLENCMRPDAARHFATEGYQKTNEQINESKNHPTRCHYSTRVYAMIHIQVYSTHTRPYTHIHTFIDTKTLSCTRAHTHTHTHTHMCKPMLTHVQ